MKSNLRVSGSQGSLGAKFEDDQPVAWYSHQVQHNAYFDSISWLTFKVSSCLSRHSRSFYIPTRHSSSLEWRKLKLRPSEQCPERTLDLIRTLIMMIKYLPSIDNRYWDRGGEEQITRSMYRSLQWKRGNVCGLFMILSSIHWWTSQVSSLYCVPSLKLSYHILHYPQKLQGRCPPSNIGIIHNRTSLPSIVWLNPSAHIVPSPYP